MNRESIAKGPILAALAIVSIAVGYSVPSLAQSIDDALLQTAGEFEW